MTKQNEMKQTIIDQDTISKVTELWHKQELIEKIGIGSLFGLQFFIFLFLSLFEMNPIMWIFGVWRIAIYYISLFYVYKTFSYNIAKLIAGRTCCFDINEKKSYYKTTFEDGNSVFYCFKHLMEALENVTVEIHIRTIEKMGDSY